MGSGSFPVRGGWREAAVLLGFALLLAGTACGKKEGSGPQGSQGAVPGVSFPASGGSGPSATGEREVVVVDPLIPNRGVPPGVSLRSAPGHAGKVLGVRWVVNGIERDIGLRLPPSAYRRGDRIRAVVTLSADGAEKVLTTPEVVAGNSPPFASAVRIEPVAPVSGGTVRAFAEARDLDDDPLKFRYQWHVDNVPVSSDSDSLALKGIKRGQWIHVKVVPNDGYGDGAWIESPRYQIVNGLPAVTSGTPKEVPPGRNLVHRIEAEDPDGDPMTYTLEKGPVGMVLNGSTLEWQVPDSYLGQPIEIVVEISDGQGGRTRQNINMTVQPPRKNRGGSGGDKEGT
ncbi:MAG: uncharacterized protein H6Q84_221 [Deltaproteobacteria bacterium]|nr:uncharacterized protein [Deltaproteobacteria bacterium]